MSSEELEEALLRAARRLGADGWALHTDADVTVLARGALPGRVTVVLLGLSEKLGQSNGVGQRWVAALDNRNAKFGDAHLVDAIQHGEHQYFFHAVFIEHAFDIRLAVTSARLGTTSLRATIKGTLDDTRAGASSADGDTEPGDHCTEVMARATGESSEYLAMWAGEMAAESSPIAGNIYGDILRRILLASTLLGFRRPEQWEVGEAYEALSAWMTAGEAGRAGTNDDRLHSMVEWAGKSIMLGSPAERVVANLVLSWWREAP